MLFSSLAVRRKKKVLRRTERICWSKGKETVRRTFYQMESNLAQPRRERYCLVSTAQPSSQGTQVSFLALPLTSCVALGKLCNLESLFTPQNKDDYRN